MRHAVVSAVVLVLASESVLCQTVTDVPLPGGLPTVLGAPFGPTPLAMSDVAIFAEHDAVAFVDGATVHGWTALPSVPAYASLALAPQQRLVVGWKVARDVLLYWSVGQDLAPNTGDERLCMVRGLPYLPYVVTTNIAPTPGVPLYPFFEVNPACAVSVSPGGFQVVRHGPSGATLQTIPVAGGISPDGAGAIGASAVAAYAGGNVLKILRGLDGPGPDTVETATMPGVSGFVSFIVSADGVCVGASWSSLPTITAYVVQIPPAPGPLVVTPFTWTGPTSGVCSFPCSAYLYAIPGGGVEVRTHDDGGSSYVILGNLRFAPVVRASSGYVFVNDQISAPLSEDEILDTFVYSTPGAFTYTRVAPGGNQSTTTSGLFDHEHTGLVRLGRGAFAYLWRSVSGTTSRITVMRDALGANATSTSSIDGAFTRVFSLGGAAVAAFVDTSGTPGFVSPTTLRIVSAPRASVEALAAPLAAAPIALTMAPSQGALSQGLAVTLQTNPAWAGTAFLFLSLSRAGLGQPGVDGLVHLDLASPLVDFPIFVNGAGIGQLAAPPGALPPTLAGLPLFIQAAIFGGGVWHVSDLGMIVLE